jgi:hypothetical protein
MGRTDCGDPSKRREGNHWISLLEVILIRMTLVSCGQPQKALRIRLWIDSAVTPKAVLRPALHMAPICATLLVSEGCLFLAVIIFQRLGADESAFGTANEPLLTVRIVDGFADRVVGNDIDEKVFVAVVDQLMRFSRLEEEGIAGFDWRGPVFVADAASP